MPEGLEAEIYRRAAERAVGRRIVGVEVDPRQADAVAIGTVLPGLTVTGARRAGKHVLLDLVRGRSVAGPVVHTLGLHFGMTGRLIVDGDAAIDRLEYGSGRDDPAWDRFVLHLADGPNGRRPTGALRVNDPRRWATFTVDPDTGRLGPDFLSVTARQLGAACAGRRAPIKAVLLDQTAIAGFGNLCVDEVLWQAGLAPSRPAAGLDRVELARLASAARRHLPAMLRRGGSHRGIISPDVRAALPACPRDGAPLRRSTVGGRTTVWCPAHQT